MHHHSGVPERPCTAIGREAGAAIRSGVSLLSNFRWPDPAESVRFRQTPRLDRVSVNREAPKFRYHIASLPRLACARSACRRRRWRSVNAMSAAGASSRRANLRAQSAGSPGPRNPGRGTSDFLRQIAALRAGQRQGTRSGAAIRDQEGCFGVGIVAALRRPAQSLHLRRMRLPRRGM